MAVMTGDECRQRAKEAKTLAIATQDLWERGMLFKIADQWELLAATHRAAKKQTVLSLVHARGDHQADPPKSSTTMMTIHQEARPHSRGGIHVVVRA
jgi:hypothetical protein